MNYEDELEFCEYNPVSVQYEKEIRDLVKIVEKPNMNFLEKIMKKIILANGAEA